MKQKLLIGFAILILGCSGCREISVGSKSPVTSTPADDFSASSNPESSPEETMLNNMTLKEKVGQLFLLAVSQDENRSVSHPLSQNSIEQLQSIQPGGIILFAKDISYIEQTRALIQTAQQTVSCPLFISIDQEGGNVQRITKTDQIPATVIPSMFRVGKTKNPMLSQQIGQVIGTELSVFGINMDFAPDCDVFSNSNNKVIGSRSFSSDPQTAAQMSVPLAQGLTDTGIIPVAKHFPGHGDTDTDPHYGYAVSNKTLNQLREMELIPFQAQIDAGIPAVMIAHISLPEINKDNTPASLSKKIITDLLRDEMDYNGLIITDALNMGAIVDYYGAENAAVQAIEAGADILVMPQNPQKAYQAILQAVQNGTISEKRIDESVLRILKIKYNYRLFDSRPLTDPSVLGCEEHQAVVNQIP